MKHNCVKTSAALVTLLLLVGCGESRHTSSLELCRVTVELDLDPLEKHADAGEVSLYEVRTKHAEGLRRQHEWLAELEGVAKRENFVVSAGRDGDVVVLINYIIAEDGIVQRCEFTFYNFKPLKMWGERMFPTPKQIELKKSFGFDLQEEPLSVSDVLDAIRLWRARPVARESEKIIEKPTSP
jgi:hypothetical protein